MSLGKISNTNVRKTIIERIIKQKLGQKSHPIKETEAYIAETKEIEGAHGLPRGNNAISDELQKVIHGVGHQDDNKTI